MKTQTLHTVRKRRTGRVLRIVLAVAIIAAAAWYLLPKALELDPDQSQLNRTLVTTTDVNLRAGPGLDHDIILVVPAETQVASDLAITNGFTKVAYSGKQGWMSADYLVAPGPEGQRVAQVQSVQASESAPEPAAPTAVPTEPVVEVPPPEPEPTAAPTLAPVIAQSVAFEPAPQPGEKWIEVNRTTRTVTLYNGEIVVAQFDALIGKDLSPDGYYSTATGTFYVHVKEKSLVETPFADGVYLTDFVGFDPHRSNGFHSPVRDQYGNVVQTGGTETLGCVRLAEDDAIFLFNFATIGMRVEVHD